MNKPQIGKITNSNGKMYTICQCCYKLVRIDKFMIGSLHVCLTDKEMEETDHRKG